MQKFLLNSPFFTSQGYWKIHLFAVPFKHISESIYEKLLVLTLLVSCHAAGGLNGDLHIRGQVQQPQGRRGKEGWQSLLLSWPQMLLNLVENIRLTYILYILYTVYCILYSEDHNLCTFLHSREINCVHPLSTKQ